MCGRVRFASEFSEIRIRLNLDVGSSLPNMAPSWNVCPTDPVFTAIIGKDGKRVGVQMKWGLVPWWSKDSKTAFKTINARAETVDTLPAFRDAWKRGQRCLVVADGFYEWRKDKQPFSIGMANGKQMMFAGLWEEWKDPKSGELIRTCAIITCAPNNFMAQLHDRMPVILDDKDFAKWLGEEPATSAELKALLVPCPDDWLTMYPVSRERLGRVRDKGREVAEPVESPTLL